MKLPAVEPVVKASKLAVAAKRNGWHGSFTSELDEDGVRVTVLEATRNDEYLYVGYRDNAYYKGEYKLFDVPFNLHCASVALEKLKGWPDIIEIFKKFPVKNRPDVVSTYRRLPFSESDSEQEIMQALIGHQIHWYSHEYSKIYVDTVLPPKKSNSKQYRVSPVGHRKIFHFISSQAGFRSVLLDTIIKVD